MLAPMRPILALVLAACVAKQPPPQGPRVVCNGMMAPAGQVVVTSSSCQEIPADRCWNDNSPECEEAEERRREANDRADRNGVLWLAGLLTVGLILVAVVATNRTN